MKYQILFLALAGSLAQAQKAAVTDLPVDGATTISVTKGVAVDRDFDILSGSAEITGDPSPLVKVARESWKKACNDWKAEIKDLNKENHVLALNCNSPKCSAENSQTTCVSTGQYQLKVRIKK